MRKVGTFDLGLFDSTEIHIYSDDNKTFYSDEKGTILLENEVLENWSVISNSPWGQTDDSYVIKANCINNYTKIPETEPKWRCVYTVIGYEEVWSNIFGYGNTEEEALKDCKDLFKYLQENYNKENKRF